MFDFFVFLWFVCGALTTFWVGRDTLQKSQRLTATDVSICVALFFGGMISLGILLYNEGDNITLFKPKNAQPTATVSPPLQSYQPPAPPPVVSDPPKKSVLDG